LVSMIVLALLPMFPGGERMLNLLPFIGTTEKSTIDYRHDLITVSMINIQRNPWFGSVNYLEAPEWEPLYINHMIDIVNTYFQIALEDGLVALALFVGVFASVVLGLYRAMHSLLDKDSEEYLLGRALLATQLAILLIIFTVSNITIIPIVYWSVAGLGVAYTQMVRKQTICIAPKRSN
jgi:O-antigen ligase